MNISTNITPIRVIFLIVFLCSIVIANASNQTGGVDPRFDSGSANLAREFQKIKQELPHERIPGNADDIQKTDKWAKDYGIGIAKIVGPGLAIAILSVLAGIIYGIAKIIRILCCKKRKLDEDGYVTEESEEKSYYFWQKMAPAVVFLFFFVFLLVGIAFGFLNNPRFTGGVVDLGNEVNAVGQDAVDLGHGLIKAITTIVSLIPLSIDQIIDQFEGIPGMADDVIDLGNDVNATALQVAKITAEIALIDVGNTSALTNITQQLTSINNSSAKAISQIANLTYQIGDNLRSAFNGTVSALESKLPEINSTVGQIVDTATDVVNQAQDLVDDITTYTDKAKSYDQTRQKVLTAVFAVVLVISIVAIVGFMVKIKVILNVFAAFGFAFLFLFWLSGSIHFLVGMALSDSCPILNNVTQGMIQNTGGDAAKVLNGCLFNHTTILESLDITAYNLSEAFNYRENLDQFTTFAKSYNSSSMNDYFNSIHNLYSYNLSKTADNITVETFGWNQSYVYEALDALNNQTDPTYYGLNNYTQADPDNYPPPKNNSVAHAKQAVTVAIQTNQTIYDKVNETRTQLYAAQHDIDVLLANFTSFQNRYNAINDSVQTLETQNVTNCIRILDNVQANITAFYTLGNCSFLGETYDEIMGSMCETMQPAIDLLTIAQFLIGICLIPMIITAEVLSYRISKETKIGPDDEEMVKFEGKEKHGDYVKAKTDSPTPTRTGITATIGSSPIMPHSSPEFRYGRRSVEASPDLRPMRQNQNYVLPPIRNRHAEEQ